VAAERKKRNQERERAGYAHVEVGCRQGTAGQSCQCTGTGEDLLRRWQRFSEEVGDVLRAVPCPFRI
jgi:hypothetical protein